MASWDTAATQNVSQIIAGSGVTLSPPYGQGIVTISAAGGSGGVTSLIAGTNITLSPTNGLGNVTINASGGGGGGSWISTATSQLDMTSYPVLTSSITGLSSINGRAYPNWVSTVTNQLDMNLKNTINPINTYGVNYISPLDYLTPGTGQASGVTWSRVASTPTGVFFGLQANRTTAGYIYTGASAVTTGLWTQRTAAGRRLWSGITSRSLSSGWACVYGGQIYRSTNNGVTWTVTAGSASLNWSGICSSENDVLKCVACVNGGGIYYTSNGGTTWTITNAPSSVAWGGIAMANDLTYVVAFTDTQVYYCTDGTGTTWSLVPGQPTLSGSTWSDVALNSFSSNFFWITTTAGVAYRFRFDFTYWDDLLVPGTCVAITPGLQQNGVVVGDSNTGQLSVSVGSAGMAGSFFTTKTIAGAVWTGVAIAALRPTAAAPSSNYTNICGVLTNGNTYSAVSGSMSIYSARQATLSAADILALNGNVTSITSAVGITISNSISSPITISNLYGQPINLQTNTLQYSSPLSSNIYVKQPFTQYGVVTTGITSPYSVTLPQAYTSATSYVVQVTHIDTNAALTMCVSRTSATVFSIAWTGGPPGVAQTIGWTAFGN